MFFHGPAVVVLIIGFLFIILSGPIVRKMFSLQPGPAYKPIVINGSIWSVRLGGAIVMIMSFFILTSGPTQKEMKKETNQVMLLEHGQTIEGTVFKASYQYLAPPGWTVVYKFTANGPVIHKSKTYWGCAQGPRKYYAHLIAGDTVKIIYYPLNPDINCEMERFLNNPTFRNTFRKAGKLELLNKFKNGFTIDNYSFDEWYRLQQQKQ
jgi:hypothetical protein